MEKTGELTSESPSVKPTRNCKCNGECKCRDTSEKLVKEAHQALTDAIDTSILEAVIKQANPGLRSCNHHFCNCNKGK